ncbi:MAG: AAA family ATPase [Alphaproteobacteria bacterium]|nr:AAA family ATPase [Alphaproteobacteria bacterium]
MMPLIGQEAQMQAFLTANAGARMHHGWILAGAKGLGKAGFARAAATHLLAAAAGPPPGGEGFFVPQGHPVRSLVEAGTHPDFMSLTRLERETTGDLARNISVDQIRSLQRLFSNAPSLSNRRVVIIDSADDMERGAANALLKNLEEPPAGTVFLLVCHAPGRLLPTIRSRCRILRFSPLDDRQMTDVLRSQLSDADEHEIAVLVAAGEGSPGRALSFVGLDLSGIEDSLAAIARDGDPANERRIALGKALSTKAARPRYEAFLERAPAFIAGQAKRRDAHTLPSAITAWEEARQLAASAIPLSLDPATVVFELCSHVAEAGRA